ncbi:acetyl-CoA C-acetyltransferase [Cellulomonas humilata]|uniref:Probable acetyl-CoA acetyltransferase n=1 Tax=Cellulomonas humilata TaxID=144055 RepID=A0A7Y6DUU4_9CELL|nr:acetyl-CoA C-acetyltransferase [Cellulomonas humilata]NUU15771.1 acetyl-CoA C-acetyltransferase [Cellulomonas humilata]
MTELREVVLCSPLRTPVGRLGGALAPLTARDLATTVLRALVERTHLDVSAVDSVIGAQGYPTMESPAFGRVAALDAGFPVTTTGYQLDRRCGSGLQAVLNAAMEVQTGVADVVVALGAESMSNAPLYTEQGRRGLPPGGLLLHDALARGRATVGGAAYPTPEGNVGTADALRAEYGISRGDQDALALRSHQRAVAAQRAGAFDAEIVPVTVPGRRGPVVVERDEHPRADTTLDALAALRPVLVASDPDATVTAGNSSGQNDAAAACIVTTPEHARRLGLTPALRLRSWAVAGVDPRRFGIAPVPATLLALDRAGATLADLDVVELNEAFAVQVLACLADWRVDPDDPRVNPRGSGISLGHPIGATGLRMLATLAHELPGLDGTLGVETMCIGGGQALAAVLERA